MITASDRTTLRELARRVAEIATLPIQAERRELWKLHNSLKTTRPLILVFPEGSWEEILTDKDLVCEDDVARRIEWELRSRIYYHEHFQDDTVIEKTWVVNKVIHNSGWGLEAQHIPSPEARGAWHFDPVIHTPADMQKLRFPEIADLFGDILDVKLNGRFWWALGLIDEWTNLRGITQTYMDMADFPEMVHAGMRPIVEGKLAWLEALVEAGLLSLNNGNDYVGSGGFGFTDQLPAEDFTGHVRLKDLWGFCEAQTMSEVSPAMHEEYVLRYQLPILERFCLNCYGCCEPLHLKLDFLLARVPRLRRISISPWADKRMSAEKLKSDVIYSWKPNPAALAGIQFDEDWVRQDIRETCDIAREHGCVLEIILKDTHTCNHQPVRFDRWTQIAMEEAQRSAE